METGVNHIAKFLGKSMKGFAKMFEGKGGVHIYINLGMGVRVPKTL